MEHLSPENLSSRALSPDDDAPAAQSTAAGSPKPNNLDAYWMPYTSNRAFKQAPRLVTGAEGMHYFTADGRTVLDATAGMWCCNAGHGRAPIVAAIRQQALDLDFAPPYQFSHPLAFTLASRIAALAPGDLDHVFFTNSGSEAADTALKTALGFHNLSGQGARQRLIGRAPRPACASSHRNARWRAPRRSPSARRRRW